MSLKSYTVWGVIKVQVFAESAEDAEIQAKSFEVDAHIKDVQINEVLLSETDLAKQERRVLYYYPTLSLPSDTLV